MRQNDFLFILCIMFILFSGIIIGFYLAMREMTSRRLFLNQNFKNYSDLSKRLLSETIAQNVQPFKILSER